MILTLDVWTLLQDRKGSNGEGGKGKGGEGFKE